MNSDYEHFSDDLDWLAFCYVNDELTANEREAFEQRLAEDQAAREAVERTVFEQALLASALQLDQSESSISLPLKSSRPQAAASTWRSTWAFGVAAAALVLVAIGIWSSYGVPSESAPSELAQGSNQQNTDDSLTNDEGEMVYEEWLEDEDYANRLTNALALLDEGDEGVANDSWGDYNPVTLQDDWMIDVYSEIGETWDEGEGDSDDSRSLKSDSSQGVG